MTNSLPDGWQEVRLGDVAPDIKRGITPKYLEASTGHTVINQRCIRDGKVSFDNARFHNNDLKKVPESKTLNINDILINSTGIGTLGRVAILKKELTDALTFDTHVSIVRVDSNKSISSFIFYQLFGRQKEIENLAKGSTGQVELSRHELNSLLITLPPIHEQKRIADILSSLDDKIENNRKMNATLESMAQAMFKSWFVDFEPVHALMKFNKGESTHKTKSDLAKSLYMNEETLNLFPDTFADNALPTGWAMKALGDVVENFDKNRIPLSKRERDLRTGTIPYYGATGIIDTVDEPIFSGEYVLVGEDGSVERKDGTPFVNLIDCECWVNNHAHVLRGKTPISNLELYFSLSCVKIGTYMTGAVQAKLNQTNMNKIPHVSATKEIHDSFCLQAKVLFDKIKINTKEIQTLTKTRDTLLPQLINGKIRT